MCLSLHYLFYFFIFAFCFIFPFFSFFHLDTLDAMGLSFLTLPPHPTVKAATAETKTTDIDFHDGVKSSSTAARSITQPNARAQRHVVVPATCICACVFCAQRPMIIGILINTITCNAPKPFSNAFHFIHMIGCMHAHSHSASYLPAHLPVSPFHGNRQLPTASHGPSPTAGLATPASVSASAYSRVPSTGPRRVHSSDGRLSAPSIDGRGSTGLLATPLSVGRVLSRSPSPISCRNGWNRTCNPLPVVCTPTRTNDVARTSTPHLPLPDKRPVSVAVYQFPEISKFQNELRSEFQNEIRNLREEKDRGKDREKDEAQASLEATIELPRRSPEETSRMEAELKSVREELAQAITVREEKDRLLQRKDTELKFLTTAKERLEADVLAKAAREAVNAKEPNKHEGQIEMLKHQRKSLDAKVDRLVAELEREKVRSGELERLVERKDVECAMLQSGELSSSLYGFVS